MRAFILSTLALFGTAWYAGEATAQYIQAGIYYSTPAPTYSYVVPAGYTYTYPGTYYSGGTYVYPSNGYYRSYPSYSGYYGNNYYRPAPSFYGGVRFGIGGGGGYRGRW